MANPSRNLVIAAVGDGSEHRGWLAGFQPRSFDVALIYYGDRRGIFRPDADFYWERKGFKYFLIDDALTDLGDRLDAYDFVWMPDDDIAATADQVNRLFEIMRDHELLIAQPAIAEGDTVFRLLRQQPGLLLRFTQFVEVMCPAFSKGALRAVRGTFRETISAWGIDWAWTRLVDLQRLAVIDAVGVRHTRPSGSGLAYERFRQQGVKTSQELRRILSKYGLRNPLTQFRRHQLKYGTRLCRAIDLSGRQVTVGRPWWKRFGRAA